MRRIALAVWVQAAVLLAAPSAHATFPYPPPPPGTAPQAYADYLRLPTTTPPVRPIDFTGGTEWKLTSDPTGDPAIDSSPAELFGVRGMSVDLAWQVTTGRPDVLIAVLDSGIRWDDVGAMHDLARKVHINRGELPLPRDAAGHTKPESSASGVFLNPDPYDLNDDGVFDVSDFANDARVQDRNGNGLLDPEDLILTFSDGTDGDGNGYVDDIAGWNFLDDDNDPFDEVSYGHGTGEAEDSTAEADNGGALGTCPNCRVMPVRVGDSFIADSNLFAEGVVFAVDSGAHIVQEALGTVNNTSFSRAAIEYAWSHDVPVIASAADEESFHHNVPAASRHTITVNSVTRFAEQSPFTMSPRSYLYLNGCTNYGGNMAVAIESSSCSSEATGRGSGIAGLLISAALNRVDAGTLPPRSVDPTGAVHPLSADEVAQLLTMTADDIDFSRSDRSVSFVLSSFGIQSRRYASQPGWDEYFGYGRANAHSGVLAVAGDAIPPEADLLEPDWWETLDPVETPVVTVTGSANATHATSYGWELSAGCGVQPTEDRFAPIASSNGVTGPLGPGTLASWSIADTALRCSIDVAGVAHTAPSGTASPDDTPDMFTVTLRLRVTDDAGRRGEARRTLYLHHDPDLRRGFPLGIAGSGEPSAFFVRLRGKARRPGQRDAGQQQLVVPTADGTILALRFNGHALPGWPVHTDPLRLHTGSRAFTSGALPTTFYESVGGGVAAGDLDGDRRTEVVAGSLAGKLYVWEQDGSRRAGFPVRTDPRFSARSARDRFNRLQPGLLAAPVLADLDGDGLLEIVAAAMDRHVYVWRADGSQQPGWPVLVVDRTQMASIDPVSHHVVPNVVGGQPVALQGTKIVSTPAVGALRGDGKPVVVVGSNEEYREASNFS
jgi:Subtilase family/FG-GAP-like repeat